MKLFSSIMLFLFSIINLFSQEVVIRDNATNEPVPYVNIFVEDSSIGTTANEEGVFKIPRTKEGQVLVFSAIGYETLKLLVKDVASEVLLIPAVVELQEIVVIEKKEPRELKIGTFKKKDIKSGFACGRMPWMVGRFFPFDTVYNHTPYLKTIKVQTQSDIKNAKMNIRLYLPDENGKPREFLYSENIIFTVKKGTSYPEINVSHLNIQFPETGLFVILEWLIIDENKYEYEYTIGGSDKVYRDGLSYEPAVGALKIPTYSNSQIYVGGVWGNTFMPIDKKDDKGIYSLLAVELTLTN